MSIAVKVGRVNCVPKRSGKTEEVTCAVGSRLIRAGEYDDQAGDGVSCCEAVHCGCIDRVIELIVEN
jgi:hypothetical protein